MADDPVIIEAQIVALEEAIAAGTLKIMTKSGEDEKEVTYGSFADLVARLNWLKRRLARLNGTDIKSTVGTFDRGRGTGRVPRHCRDGWDQA